ncbi:hypothetical protein QTN25_008678 [Entamoeba marina]
MDNSDKKHDEKVELTKSDGDNSDKPTTKGKKSQSFGDQKQYPQKQYPQKKYPQKQYPQKQYPQKQSFGKDKQTKSDGDNGDEFITFGKKSQRKDTRPQKQQRSGGQNFYKQQKQSHQNSSHSYKEGNQGRTPYGERKQKEDSYLSEKQKKEQKKYRESPIAFSEKDLEIFESYKKKKVGEMDKFFEEFREYITSRPLPITRDFVDELNESLSCQQTPGFLSDAEQRGTQSN